MGLQPFQQSRFKLIKLCLISLLTTASRRQVHAKVLRTPPRFSMGRVVRKFTSIVAWVSLPTSTRSPVAVWHTVFGRFFLDKTLTCPLSSVAWETTWYELPESRSQKTFSPDSTKEGATMGIAKYAPSRNVLTPFSAPLPTSPFVVGWLLGAFGAALAAATALPAVVLSELPAVPVVTVALAS